MTRTTPDAALARLAAANPVPSPLPNRAPHAAPRRWLVPVAAGILAAAVAAPAVATSQRVRDLFGFSNSGTPVARSSLRLDQAGALARVGFAGEVRKLAERQGLAFYVGRTSAGALCFSTGPAGAAAPEFGVLACQGRVGPGVFPSAETPIADFSPLRGAEGDNAVRVWQLAGFAADGVARVGVRDRAGVFFATPVADNVYGAQNVPARPATAIVALDADGNELYTKSLESTTPG
jgi:hypothetical protein